MQHIAIIGAGLAGLSTLQHLDPALFRVTLFEKSRGPGGRLSSKKVGESSWDMGAQYLRAHSSEFADQLNTWEKDGLTGLWPVTPAVIDESGLKASPDDTQRFVGTPRMTAISRALSQKAADFHSQTRIVRTRKHQGQWLLNCEAGNEYGPFDTLVIAVPPQQAVDLLPEDSALRQPVSEVNMDPSWTLLISCQETLLPGTDAAYVHTGPLRWIARNNAKPGRATEQAWVIQANAEWSNQHLETPRVDVQQQLLGAFREISGADTLTLNNVWLHRWLYALPGDASAYTGPTQDAEHSLFLCGDWTHRGSAEGAWLSGRETAHKIIEKGTV